MSEAEIQAEREELVDELAALVKGKARHQSHLHETDAAKADKGGMKFCLGCRANIVSQRLAQLESVLDDHGPNGVEKVMEKIKERKQIEA